MGKKQKEDTPNVNAVANKDILQRLNFLYQASVYLQSLDVDRGRNPEGVATLELDTQPKECMNKRKKFRPKAGRRRTSDLARDYIHCMRQVAQKTTVKIDPSLKRSLCFSCNSALVPGVSVSLRVKDSDRNMSYICLHCKARRRIVLATNDRTASRESHRVDHSEKPKSHPLPLFARPDVGHVIFRGNDPVSLDEAGRVPFV